MRSTLDGPLSSLGDRFPLEVVRDLLGITRAMFLAAKTDVALMHQLDELVAIGKKFRLAFDLARKTRRTRSAIARRGLTPKRRPRGS
jgi:hypothetical protein